MVRGIVKRASLALSKRWLHIKKNALDDVFKGLRVIVGLAEYRGLLT